MLRTILPSRLLTALLPLVIGLSTPARAHDHVPHVATDIAPVHALVAQVMQGIGTPDLILPTGASPHGYAMRPSEAAALADADLVVWVGPTLTPWLEKSLDTIASGAARLTLTESSVTTQLPFRETAIFGEEDDHDDDHGAGNHEEHDHGHEEGAMDPHVWLDPINAQMWLDLIADDLAKRDHEHADVYLANAKAARESLEALIADTRRTLTPLADTRFVVFHDAYQYFEARFGLNAAGAISLGDASRPSPAHIAALRDAVNDGQITCALAEPQFNSGLIDTVFAGIDVTIQVIDPIGATLTPGPELYAQLLRGMADRFSGCAK